MRRAPVLMLVVALAGCASQSDQAIPKDYTGPVALVRDMMAPIDSASAKLFVVTKIDGRSARSPGGGGRAPTFHEASSAFALEVELYHRNVPAQPATYTISGRIAAEMRIIEMLTPGLDVSGDVQFSPEVHHIYAVTGEIGKTYSAVWIVDAQTGERVTEKVERRAD